MRAQLAYHVEWASACACDAVGRGCEVRILGAVMSDISAFATALKHWLSAFRSRRIIGGVANCSRRGGRGAFLDSKSGSNSEIFVARKPQHELRQNQKIHVKLDQKRCIF